MSNVNFPPPGGVTPERGFLDKTFGNTNIILLVIFAFCCNGIALILGILGIVMCKEPLAKRNATIVTVIGGAIFVLGLIARIMAPAPDPALLPGGPAPVGIPAPANP